MLSDIEISQQNKLVPITEIAASVGLNEDDIELYGKYKAKISYAKLQEIASSSAEDGKLILVTAMTPTPAGEGKSTVSIGLGDALHRMGKKVMIALREPSLGPCFGRKGGATGGGYSQIVPMEEINLHFTGDIHAVTVADNLLASLLDNHIYQGNKLNINPQTITWRRCVDLNDRVLRHITIGQGAKTNGVERQDGFDISVASEIMAILCLAQNIKELKNMLGNIVIAQTFDGQRVKAADLGCVGALAAVLKDALKPNLVQTLEKTPALVHGGPFANIAHGCNSLIATQTALKLADYVVTEAGFGADLGAEKFMDIKCRKGHLKPAAVVIVATVRALKMHGGVCLDELNNVNEEALRQGFANLRVHIENMQKFGLPVIVALNRFSSDMPAELQQVVEMVRAQGIEAVVTEGWAKGGEGVLELAEKVVELTRQPNDFKVLYSDTLPLEQKIEKIALEIYQASAVEFSDAARKKLQEYEREGYGNLPVCMAKTQNSVSHDKNKLGAPSGYVLPVRDVRLSAGAGFIVALSGDILTMPGLPKTPAAENIDLDDNGVISGLF